MKKKSTIENKDKSVKKTSKNKEVQASKKYLTKTLTNSSTSSKPASKTRRKVQTAEGWKRSMLKIHAKKQAKAKS